MLSVHLQDGRTSVVYQSQDHAVQVNEEAEEVISQLNHGLLHVGLELTPVMNLSGVKHTHVSHRDLYAPVNVPGSNRQVEEKDEPVHGDQHQHRRHTLSNYLWNHPFIQLGAAGSSVDVVTF